MSNFSVKIVLIGLSGALCVGCSSSSDSSKDGGTQTADDSGQSTNDSGQSTNDGGSENLPLTATKLTPSTAFSAAYVTALPSGHVVISDYTTPGIFEMDGEGMVVASNTTDFSLGGNTPSVLAANSSGKLVVQRSFMGAIYFPSGIESAPIEDYVTTASSIYALGWGADDALYTFSGRPNGKLEIYNSSNDTSAGAGTLVASVPGAVGSFAVDSSGTAYVLNGGDCEIVRVTSSGDAKTIVNNPDNGDQKCATGEIQEGYIGQSAALALDSQKRLIVSDTQNHRVLRIAIAEDDTTTTVNLYENADFDPTSLAVAPNGDIFVVDAATKAVWKLH